MNRKAPIESANDFPERTFKRHGNIVFINIKVGKFLKWYPIGTIIDRPNKFGIKVSFSLMNKLPSSMRKSEMNDKLKKIGVVDCIGGLTMGDSLVYKVGKSGKYHIYSFGYSLIASNKPIIISSLNKTIWTITSVTVDMGVFTFRDLDTICRYLLK